MTVEQAWAELEQYEAITENTLRRFSAFALPSYGVTWKEKS